MKALALNQEVPRHIYFIRGEKVMLDQDLADLYEVSTKVFVQAVKRNRSRFPGDFMFQLSERESEMMRSQFVTASRRNIRFRPFVFTEQGVAMLSSILRSRRAIQVNITIMRNFVKIREFLQTHRELARKLEAYEEKIRKNDQRIRNYSTQINTIFSTIQKLMDSSPKRKKSARGSRGGARR